MKILDKALLGVLFIVIVGINGFLITAMTAEGVTGEVSSVSSESITQDEAIAIAVKAVPGSIIEVDLENENGALVYEVDIDRDGTEIEVVIDRSTGLVLSIEEEEVDVPITGTPLELASAAALDYLGEGRVTDTEIGDEEGYYEIEVTLDNGEEVDVHLDRNFKVLSVED